MLNTPTCRRIVTVTVAASLALGPVAPIFAQKKFALTIENIMRGPGLYGYEPNNVRWSGDGSKIYFSWKQASDPIDHPNDTYVVGRDGSGLRKLTDAEVKLAPPAFGSRTRDRKHLVYAQDGDLFIYDFSNDTRKQLTKTIDSENNPAYTQDEKHIAFTRGGNLYTMALDSGMIEEMTDIQAAGAAATPAPAGGGRGGGGGGRGGRGGGGAPPTATGDTAAARGTDSQEFLKKQEKELLEIVKERAARREENEAKRKKEQTHKPFQLQARQSANRLELCPDEKCVIAMVNEAANGAKNENVPNYITESAYTEDINGRTNVGDAQNRQRVAILDVATGESKWVDAGLGNREIQLQAPVWNEAGHATPQ